MKGYGKRIVSAVLVVAMLTTLLPALIRENSYHAEASEQPERLDKSGDRVRGVVTSLEEAPVLENAYLGTAEYPFVVLEIVPYEEYAEFGYLISGCEPVKIQDIFVKRNEDTIKVLDTLGTAEITPLGYAYFFDDEDVKEYKKYADYIAKVISGEEDDYTVYYYNQEVFDDNDGRVYGYFKRVENEGNWRIVQQDPSVSPGDAGSVSQGDEVSGSDAGNGMQSGSILSGPNAGDGETTFPFERVDSGKGDWIWHSCNEEELKPYADALGSHFTAPYKLDPDKIEEDREDYVYTWRTPTEEQECIKVENYYTYKNNDFFLKQSLGLSEEQAENYSIVVKTITPGELNNKDNQKWIDRANLIYLSSASHTNGHNDSDVVKIWKEYGWLSEDGANYTGHSATYVNNDLNWDTTVKLYRKVANEPDESQKSEWEPDYAALIMDDNIYNPSSDLLTGTSQSVTLSVYDWNFAITGDTARMAQGKNNNIYKLGTMLVAMDTSLFTNLYLNPVNDNKDAWIQDGKDTRRNGTDASSAWSVETFLLKAPYMEADYASLDEYWTSDELWNNYHSTKNLTTDEYKYWVNDHVFSCPGSNGILTDYSESYGDAVNDVYVNRFSEFAEYCKSLSAEISQGADGPCPADAVNYILRDIKKVRTKLAIKTDKEKAEEEERSTINVLDLEPSVGLTGSQANMTPNWILQESFVQMMLGGCDNKIEITHQTTAEFISKTEDLVSEYQLIYLGLDVNGYNTDNESVNVTLKDGTKDDVDLYLPQWNDHDNLGNRIYTHSGDWLYFQGGIYTSDNKDENAKAGDPRNIEERPDWIWTGEKSDFEDPDYDTKTDRLDKNDWYVRFPGNDISHQKMLELEEFIAAGHPVVAERYLYNLEDDLIDPTSFIYQFVGVNAQKKGYTWNLAADARPGFECSSCSWGMTHPNIKFADASSKVYSTADVVSVNGVLDFREKVIFEILPAQYPEYLKDDGEYADLEFEWTINGGNDDNDWRYKIYVDMDGDLKFEDTEVIRDRNAFVGNNKVSYAISTLIPGPVEWKIEVYRQSNPAERYVETGCSAVRATNRTKTTIKVLQIMPSYPATQHGYLNMADDVGFKKLYQDLVDYEINVTSITMKTYESYFEGDRFDYDVSGDTDSLNSWQDRHNLLSYDVIIVGFEDSSGLTDIKDTNGAVQFLWYWADQGRGILFTHDLTSMYISMDMINGTKKYGNSSSNLLRDVMGMNRYGVTSAYAGSKRVKMLLEYQQQQTANDLDKVHFDWMEDETIGRQGYTYVALFFFSATAHMNVVSEKTPSMLYKSMPQTSNLNQMDNNWLSRSAARINKGQVTVYPYEIGDELKVAQTHTQYYSLNPEDEDVIVWYSLSKNIEGSTSNTYSVSPNDALNNYYIYSKNNIFYSGVGHWEINTDPLQGDITEAQLLVNVMIAAYKASNPVVSFVEIEDAEEIESEEEVQKAYELKLTQDYADSFWESDPLYKLGKDDIDGDDYEIRFRPIDANPHTTKMEGIILYQYTDKDGNTYTENITDIVEVTRVDGGTTVDALNPVSSGIGDIGDEIRTKVGTGIDINKVLPLTNYGDYCLTFSRSDLFWKTLKVDGEDTEVDVASSRIIFYLRNNITQDSWSKTTLDISILPLFMLD